VRGAELDPAGFVTVERDLAPVWDGRDRREGDERNARILAAHPATTCADPNPQACSSVAPAFAARRGDEMARPRALASIAALIE
jgi:hypothetical protein